MVLRSKHPSVSCPVPNKALLWSPSSSWPPHLWQADPVVCGVDRRDDRQSMSWFTKHRMFIGWRQSFPSLQVEHALCPCCGLFFFFFFWLWVLVKLLSHIRLCNPHGLYPIRLLRPWDFPGKSTGAGCHFLLQEIFPTQGVTPGLPHCRQMLYRLSHQGSPDF